jgi:hypothetical protein
MFYYSELADTSIVDDTLFPLPVLICMSGLAGLTRSGWGLGQGGRELLQTSVGSLLATAEMSGVVPFTAPVLDRVI